MLLLFIICIERPSRNLVDVKVWISSLCYSDMIDMDKFTYGFKIEIFDYKHLSQ